MRFLAFLMFALMARWAFAQSSNQDSLDLHGRMQSDFQKADSVKGLVAADINSLQTHSDSVTRAATRKANSIRDQFKTGIDSLQRDYKATFSKIESQRNSLQHKIDSLSSFAEDSKGRHVRKLLTRKFTHKLDSLERTQESKLNHFNKKVSALKSKATAELHAVNLPPQLQEPMQKLMRGIEDYKLPGLENLGMELSGIDLPKLSNLELPEFKGMEVFKHLDAGQLTGDLKIPDAGDLSKVTQDLKLPDLGNVSGQLAEVKEVSGQVSAYGNQAKDIVGQAGAYGNELKEASSQLNQPNALDKAAESQLMRIDEVKDLNQELQKNVGDLSKMTGGLSEDALKERAKTLAMEEAMKNVNQAVNHFAGKEQQVQKAMQSVSKLKTKFSSVKSLGKFQNGYPIP